MLTSPTRTSPARSCLLFLANSSAHPQQIGISPPPYPSPRVLLRQSLDGMGVRLGPIEVHWFQPGSWTIHRAKNARRTPLCSSFLKDSKWAGATAQTFFERNRQY